MKSWTWKEVFDRGFFQLVWNEIQFYVEHFSRLILLSVLIFQFFGFAIVPTESMDPTIQPNDLIVFEKKGKGIHRGDVVVFKKDGELLVKRVVALEHDTVEVKNGRLWVNGKRIHEPYVREIPQYELERQRVPKNSVFVLGDNRNHSVDSASFGAIPVDQIKGRVTAVLLPLRHLKQVE
ncbi:signal peptidase I [Geobacillus subterraneus]|uniref:Signal peptidase I n=1 Tax=Geobacillus subterraneus TaxID=129338 RepID=A0A679FS15_9BACL|nr:signal peptidase I [Geobacillus subterraneus]BBW98930.1 signal peptidase I [Geobacillus subterraneus]